jgi:hypothetical protein
MKTDRVTILTTKEFKRFLGEEAKREGVSVAELIRSRCAQKPAPDEALLAELTVKLHRSLREAKASLREGLEEARATTALLRSNRENSRSPATKKRT